MTRRPHADHIAEDLRSRYFGDYHATPWDELSEDTRRTWIDLAEFARDLWEGIPR